MTPPLGRRLQLFTGKGGVGKTTLVCALGLALAERGKRPLIVELGYRSSVEALLGVGGVGWEPIEVSRGLHATNVDGERAVREVLVGWLGMRPMVTSALRSEAMRAFLEAAPAVIEVATIGRIFALLEEQWDPILIDADATGHARMFLSLPSVFDQLGAGGAVLGLLSRSRELFADREHTALHVVTLPGALPAREARELIADLDREGHVRVADVIVNRAPEQWDLPLEPIRAARVRAGGGLAADLELLAAEIERGLEAKWLVAALSREAGVPVIALPDLDVPRIDRDALRALGRALVDA